jgi:hypothetical protein
MTTTDEHLFDPGPAIPPRWKEAIAACRTHGHATIGEAGACPSCRQHQITICADAPHGWVLWFPDTHQIAVVRTWGPTGDDDAVCTAWATGCNTGGTIGWEPVDPATIEWSGVEPFTLLSGPDASAALAALGVDPPWNHDIVEECPCCGDPIVIGADGDEP